MAGSVCIANGWRVGNFAKSIRDEENGVWANAKMNKYFWAVDEALSEIHQSDNGVVFDELNEIGITVEMLANLTEKDISKLLLNFVSPLICSD